MKIQKQLSKKTENKIYNKYVVVLPEKLIKESGLKEGEDIIGSAKKGEINLKKK
jgi:bifunctional DNA-binding transcriptional regulator/antitoxin component of YhaV-PrlF toxin-antitoxin module|tara:strand:- start:1936 stop:2097 length:162 start_codon:yes stop_codon:yes gene_type:complete